MKIGESSTNFDQSCVHFGRVTLGKTSIHFFLGGARGVVIIVVGNGHDGTSSNPGPG